LRALSRPLRLRHADCACDRDGAVPRSGIAHKWRGLWLQADLLLQSDSADPLLPLVRATELAALAAQ
jgi:hypothetical protein